MGGNPAEFSVHELGPGLSADVQTIFPGRSVKAFTKRILAVMTFQFSRGNIELAVDHSGPAMDQVCRNLSLSACIKRKKERIGLFR